MKQHLRSVPIGCILFILFMPLSALDKIILENGTAVECKIVKQSEEEVVYEKDGNTVTLKKADIRSVELDIDVDKFFNAAQTAETTDKKILYLTKSIQNFPDKDANKLALAKVYITENMLDKADDILRGHNEPPYQILAALVKLRRGDRAGAARMLAAIDRAALDEPLQMYHIIVDTFIRLDNGDLDGALDIFQQGKDINKTSLLKRFESVSPRENAKDFQKRLIALRDAKAAQTAAASKQADAAAKQKEKDDAQRAAMATNTSRKLLSSIDLSIRIPASFNTVFTASTGTWIGFSFGGGIGAGVTMFENMLWQDSKFSFEAFAMFTDDETILPTTYFADGSFIRQFDIRWGLTASVWITREWFAGIGISFSSIIAGWYGNASFSAPLTNTMVGSDMHLSLIGGYSFTLTESLSIPLAMKVDWILPVNLTTSLPFEFGILAGITWKIGIQ